MAGILDLLDSDMGRTLVHGVSNQTGQPKDKTENLLLMAMPLLMSAMKRNASTPQGAESLMNAINTKHDGSVLNHLQDIFAGGINDDYVTDGGKILNHVLGNKQPRVEHALSKKSGIDAGTVAQILKVAAPILMGVLGSQAKQKNVRNSGGIGDVLGGLLKGNSPRREQTFLESILDADGDGSIIDDVGGMILGGDKKKSGLGGLLGGIFGKR